MDDLNTISNNELLIKLEKNKIKKQQKREKLMEWVQLFISERGQENCLFVTLASNKDHSICYIQKAIDDWLNNICSRIFKCRKDELTNKDSINLLAFIELNKKGYRHYHLVLYISPRYKDYFIRLCDRFWKKRVYDGTTDIQDISDRIGLSEYVTKGYSRIENKDYFYCF